MKITFHATKEDFSDVTIDTYDVDMTKYQPGCMVLTVCPFFECPLRLEFAICKDGRILVRSWTWDGKANSYAHVSNISTSEVEPTNEMADSLAGLVSGRIKIRGLKISIGNSPQTICPLNLEEEEKKCGNKIYYS